MKKPPCLGNGLTHSLSQSKEVIPYPVYNLLRSRSQLGRERIFTLETMPIAAYMVMVEEPP